MGVVGCGAATERYYAPALRVLEAEGALRVRTLFDPVPAARMRISSRLPGSQPVDDLDALLGGGLDLVIIASPPRVHRAQAIAALSSGHAVLCEKPLALARSDAEAMVRAAAEAGRPLLVGLVRRFFPAARQIRTLLEQQVIGELHRFSCFEGGPFTWPVRSPSYFERAVSGGGVLFDIGPHILDLLHWWLGPPDDVEYQDDAMGGVEVNCRIRLAYTGFEGEVRLSRDWYRPNRYVFDGTKGRLAWTVNEADRLELHLCGADHSAELLLHEAPARPAGVPLRPAENFHQSFVEQIRHALAAAAGRPSSAVPGAVALDSLGLIERCYRERTPLAVSWMGEAERQAAWALAGP